MEHCRWEPLLADSMNTVEEGLIVLPEVEQVSRGQKLLGMLKCEAHQMVSSDSPRRTVSSPITVGTDWNVVVKQTFIEVVIPSSRRSMRRSMSDSVLPRFQSDSEEQWKSIVPDKLEDLSDKSTIASVAGDDLDANFGGSSSRGLSSDDEADSDVKVDADMLAPNSLPDQYAEQWWMPMGFDANASTMCPGMVEPSAMFNGAFMPDSSTMLDASYMTMWPDLGVATDETTQDGTFMFDSSAMLDASYMAMQWPNPNMGALEGQGASADDPTQEWRTTVMIRNMPNNYSREMLLELVDSMGFEGAYDFAYLPIDFQTQSGLGYAFINFISVAEAQLCFDQFEGFCDWKVPSEKVCTVTWSSPTQGFHEHIERYQNSPVMHPSLPDEWKPVLLQEGKRVPFPPPTKPIKAPKVRQHPSVKNA